MHLAGFLKEVEGEKAREFISRNRSTIAHEGTKYSCSGSAVFGAVIAYTKLKTGCDMKSQLTTTSLILIFAALGCTEDSHRCTDDCPPVVPCADTDGICPDAVQVSELMAKNDGAWVDNALEADDWIEIANTGEAPASLLGYSISDSQDTFHFLPPTTLQPGEVILIWADTQMGQGPDHVNFKLSSDGETLFVWAPDGRLVDRVAFPALAPNDSYRRGPDGNFATCHWATPNGPNGDHCGPPPPVEIPTGIEFEPYDWPDPWPHATMPLTLNELALRPATFIEVFNTSAEVIDLSEYQITLAPHSPGAPWPNTALGVSLTWPQSFMEAGERVLIEIDSTDVTDVANNDFEGVVTLWHGADVIDRIDFMAWPEGSTLARVPDTTGLPCFCSPTPLATNDACEPLQARVVNDRLRHFYTPGDFAALAEGGVAVGMEVVKFVVDMEAGDVVHLLSSEAWDLHYTFIREIIDEDPHLDRCAPADNQVFYQGWVAFSQREYFAVDTRRYLLGTLVHHAGSALHTVEFAPGDKIIAPQMLRAFFDVVANTQKPNHWFLRPQGSQQVEQMLLIDGEAPIVDSDEPFRGVTFQPLAEGIAYGVLTFVPIDQLRDTPLGRQVIVVTDQVPNDIPLVGGLITEAFQTPLAHVNVLSRNRGTPNMALVNARSDLRIAPLLGTLVRFEVAPGQFTVRAAEAAEAKAFWESQNHGGEPLIPRLDTSVRGVIPLSDQTMASLPVIGAKAAGLAELGRVVSTRQSCPGPVTTPHAAAAIAVVHSLEHYQTSGAADLLAVAEANPEFASNPQVRAQMLAEVRQAVLNNPVDATLLNSVETYINENFGDVRVRFRSSSNTEDLPGFNGAGLYTSVRAQVSDPDQPVDDAIRTIWASLFNARAYDERALFNIDNSKVAMGILIHPSFVSEEANGVAISRDIFEPIRSDRYYINTQVGEASVTNPAAGVTTEQLTYRWGTTPRVLYQAHSSLPHGNPVLSEAEVDVAACTLRAIHDHFEPILDPMGDNRWFAMDVEFKLVTPGRQLVVKQARPYSFGNADIPADCREF